VSKQLEDVSILFYLIQQSDEWIVEEFGEKRIELNHVIQWKNKYDYLKGQWRVWILDNLPIGVTFHVPTAPSNRKPWIGALLIHCNYRRKGYGKKILNRLSEELYNSGHSVLYAGVPFSQINWGIFIGKCGFEQIALQKDHLDKSYTIYGKSLE
jgi:GNAT superfamily N-acetyltransferase